MRIPRGFRRIARRGFSLIECLVYCGLFVLLLTLAGQCYYRVEAHSRGLRRNADEITRALGAGEHWRQDIRCAQAAPRVTGMGTNAAVEVSTARGAIRYEFHDGAIWRQAADQPKPSRVLGGVLNSRMTPDPRREVQAWRWEVELVTQQKSARLKPLFTFEAALAKKGTP